jgi:hypothetical protein
VSKCGQDKSQDEDDKYKHPNHDYKDSRIIMIPNNEYKIWQFDRLLNNQVNHTNQLNHGSDNVR